MKDAPLHSYPWYVADWRGSETRLTLTVTARYIFRELLDYCWIEGSIPNDEAALARIAAVELKELRSVWPTLKSKFIEREGRLTHWRVIEKRPKLQGWANSRVKGGQKGGHSKAEAIAIPVAIASRDLEVNPLPPLTLSLTPLQDTTCLSEEKKSGTISSTKNLPPSATTPEGLWTEKLLARHPTPCEPYHVATFCFNNWHRLGEDPDKYEAFMTTVYEGLEEFCRYWAEDGNRFAMALDKWLNAGGWKKAPPERKTALTDKESRIKRQEAIDASWEIT